VTSGFLRTLANKNAWQEKQSESYSQEIFQQLDFAISTGLLQKLLNSLNQDKLFP